MDKFKILFIQANTTFDTLIPPNLALLSAYAKKNGIDTKLFDTTFYKTTEKIGDDVRAETLQIKKTDFTKLGIYLNTTDIFEDFRNVVEEYKPDLIGLSVISATYHLGIKLLQSVSDLNILTIVGGIHAIVNPEEVIQEECVDIVCIGEGEKALVELCQRIQNNEDYTDIKNLWIKKDEKIYKNEIRPLEGIDDIPFQDWSIFDIKRRYKAMGGKIRVTSCVEFDRGCPYFCSFCSNNFLKKLYHGKYYRERSVKKFIEEVLYLKKEYNIEYLYISADSFLVMSDKRFNEFIEEYSKIKIPFFIETRPESIVDWKIKKLKEVGCEVVNIGIESGDPELRDNLIHRHMKNEDIINAVKIAKKYHVRIGANNIIGFPDETREQIFKTINVNKEANPDSVMVYIFNPYHGTELYDYCLKKGYITKDILGGDYRMDNLLKMPQISNEEIQGLQRTFSMYVKFPKSRWNEIKLAETDDIVFKKLSEEYKEKYLAYSKDVEEK